MRGITLNDDRVDLQTRNLKYAKHIAIGQRARFWWRAGLLEFSDLGGLIDVRIRKDEAGVGEGENAKGEKRAGSDTEDARSP